LYRVKENKAIKDCEIIIETESDGSKKIGLKTDDQAAEIQIINKERKVEVKNVTNSKTNCDVKTTDNTHTSINTSSSTNNTDTNVNTNVNTNVKVGFNKNINEPKMQTRISIASSGDNANTQTKQLIIVDGNIISEEKMSNIDVNTIKSINVYKNSQGVEKYGEEGKNGVIEIETK